MKGIRGGVTLEGIRGGVTLEGTRGGVTLEGTRGGVTLEGTRGGVTLEGIRGGVMQTLVYWSPKLMMHSETKRVRWLLWIAYEKMLTPWSAKTCFSEGHMPFLLYMREEVR